MIQKVKVEEFLALAQQYAVLDVRSPGEYSHAHIPGAYNLPLFSDEERKVVGTAYVQESRAKAVKAGLDFFSVRMKRMVEETEAIIASHSAARINTENCVLVHCWRGGMRSASVAWLLDLYGFKVYVLDGGYKAFRHLALQQLERPYSLNVIGGYTGSGKTRLLKEMAARGHAIIDLEQIAHHKGSAFGGLGEVKQPSHEMFENELGFRLYSIANETPAAETIWIEDESRRIGDINLPNGFWNSMRRAPVYFLDVPFELRLDFILNEYGVFSREELTRSIVRIQKRLGGLGAKNAMNYLIEGNYRECFRILLHYYDKYYGLDLQARSETTVPVYKIACDSADAHENIERLIKQTTLA